MNAKAGSRQKIIETASDLFQTHGYNATGLNEIIKKSGSPKGSLYYYFPKGKEELGVAAAEYAGKCIVNKIRQGLDNDEDPSLAIQAVIKEMVAALKKNGKLKNTSLSLVALETYLTSDPLRQACSRSFTALENIYAEKLKKSGFPDSISEELGTVIQSIMEGAILLSVTHKNTMPLISAARQIKVLISHYA